MRPDVRRKIFGWPLICVENVETVICHVCQMGHGEDRKKSKEQSVQRNVLLPQKLEYYINTYN